MEELLRELLEEVRIQNTLITEQTARLEEQAQLLSAKDAQIAALTEEVARLTARIEELTHRKDSGNSSTPPSADRLKKPAPKSLREKSGRKPGGQQGHRGSGMKIDRKPDEILEHLPEACKGCPRAGQCKMHCCDTRYEYEAIVTTKLIAHKAMGCTCLVSGEAVRGEFQAGITGTKQYGRGVFGLATTLYSVGYMSVDRIRKLLNSLRIPISAGTVQDMTDRAALLSEEPAARIKQRVADGDVVNSDETGLRVAGALFWLHCARKGSWFSYSVQKKQGTEGMDARGFCRNSAGLRFTTSGSRTRNTRRRSMPCAVRIWNVSWSMPQKRASRPGLKSSASFCRPCATAETNCWQKPRRRIPKRSCSGICRCMTAWWQEGSRPTRNRSGFPDSGDGGRKESFAASWSASGTSRPTSCASQQTGAFPSPTTRRAGHPLRESQGEGLRLLPYQGRR